MKLVIDIPKTVYKACKEKMDSDKGGLWLEAIIAKGTPLPECRLIDADKLLKAIANSGLIWETNECIDVIETLAVKKIIDDAPTVIEGSKKI